MVQSEPVSTTPGVDAAVPRLVSVAGSRRVECLCAGAGKTVVLSSPSWWPLDAWLLAGVPELADGFRVIAFNHRGIGRSEPGAEGYSVQTLATDLLDLLDALQVEQAHLVGFAIGSVIAMHAAIQAPHRVRSLVIGAAGAGEPERPGRSLPPGILADIKRSGYRAYIRQHALNEQAFGSPTRAEHPERLEALAEALWRHAGAEEEFLKHAEARRGHNTQESAAQVHQPALVIVGAEDHAARGPSTPAALAPVLAERLPRGRLSVVPGVRHMLFWDQPDVVWPRVRAFLDEVDQAGPGPGPTTTTNERR